ncbi:MAG: hypothetical protein FJX76_03170 [Armatimonadetes bacterium]|nr:hypothetical protein [Armatimonadota bacterium]
MSELRAHVRDGHLILNVPTDLPDGTVLDLVVDDEGDDLSEEERRALHQVIARAWESVKAGRAFSAEEVLGDLRRRRA